MGTKEFLSKYGQYRYVMEHRFPTKRVNGKGNRYHVHCKCKLCRKNFTPVDDSFMKTVVNHNGYWYCELCSKRVSQGKRSQGIRDRYYTLDVIKHLSMAVDIDDVLSKPTGKKAWFHCKNGGPDFEQNILSHIRSEKSGKCGCGCDQRGDIEPYPDYIIDQLYDEDDKELARSGMLRTTARCVFVCPKCGELHKRFIHNVYTKSSKSLRYGRENNEIWCSACACKSQESVVESNLRKLVKSIYSSTIKDKNFFPNLNGKGQFEGDIIVRELKKCIEVDGTHFHTEYPLDKMPDHGGVAQGYHARKDAAIEAKGYIVYHIVAEDLSSNWNEEISKIRHWLKYGTESVHSVFET